LLGYAFSTHFTSLSLVSLSNGSRHCMWSDIRGAKTAGWIR